MISGIEALENATAFASSRERFARKQESMGRIHSANLTRINTFYNLYGNFRLPITLVFDVISSVNRLYVESGGINEQEC